MCSNRNSEFKHSRTKHVKKTRNNMTNVDLTNLFYLIFFIISSSTYWFRILNSKTTSSIVVWNLLKTASIISYSNFAIWCLKTSLIHYRSSLSKNSQFLSLNFEISLLLIRLQRSKMKMLFAKIKRKRILKNILKSWWIRTLRKL